ncbi:MAG: DUF975 family protein [Bacteroidales bacterium]|jgi:uncharacterized membrane protein|nr:DUF975 family protein [Bacteroidales bacterium]
MTPNVLLMQKAKESLQGMWGTAAITTLFFGLLEGAITCIPGLGLIFGGPLALGYIIFLMTVKSDKPNARIERIFDGFKDFSRTLVAYVLVLVYIFLWTLLFIIPGIIMAYAYSMTFFILAEDKNISASDALKKSKQMMMGYKWKLFCLNLRFFGWAFLCILTLGIGFFWLRPYVYMSHLNFYHDITGKLSDTIKDKPVNSNIDPNPDPNSNITSNIDESYRMDDNSNYSPTAEETNENIIDENIPGVGVEIVEIEIEVEEHSEKEE